MHQVFGRPSCWCIFTFFIIVDMVYEKIETNGGFLPLTCRRDIVSVRKSDITGHVWCLVNTEMKLVAVAACVSTVRETENAHGVCIMMISVGQNKDTAVCPL